MSVYLDPMTGRAIDLRLPWWRRLLFWVAGWRPTAVDALELTPEDLP